MFASVTVDINNSYVSETYDYIIPKNLEEFVDVGSRVHVPFGSQTLLGYVLEIKEESEFKYTAKEIKEVIDYDNDLSKEQIYLAKYINETYYVSLTKTLELMIPSFLKGQQKKYIVVSNYDKLNPDLAIMFNGKTRLPMDNKIKERNDLIKKEIEKGNITVDYDLYTYGKGKKKKVYSIGDGDAILKSIKREIIYEYVKEHDNISEDDIITNLDCSYNILREMVKDKTLKYKEIPIIDAANEELKNNSPYNYSFDDLETIDKYKTSKKRYFLLHSNREDFKVNFYIKVIEEAKKQGKSVLITSPTIMLCEEVVMYLKRYLKGYKIYSMSSKNTMKERYEAYMNAKYDNLDVLVTTHTGIFLPFNNLGAIIVLDEENPNYINENYPYYNAIDVLKQRAKYNYCDLILTSSSPSIDTYYKTLRGEYNLLTSFDRIKNNMNIVDMKEEVLNGSSTIISNTLKKAIDEALENKKQVMLLVSSKAYTNQLRCRSCGKVLKCPKCNVSLTLYKDKGYAKCNYCDYKAYNYQICKCGGEMIALNYGEEKISEEIKEMFPNAKVLDVNADLMKTLDDYNKALNDIEENNVDIIIGTQILSKTIKSDNIKLVGIINADSYLNRGNHMSNEYTFNLIAKLSNKENVYIQTYNKDNKIINLASRLDFDTYYKNELEIREALGYNPFMEINRISVSGDFKQIYYFANYIKKVIENVMKATVLGPTYDNKIKGVKLIIKHNEFNKLVKILSDTKERFKKERLTVSYERCPKYL